MEGTEVEKEIEEMTHSCKAAERNVSAQMRLYYYKQGLLTSPAAGLPYVERMIMRRAIYFLPEDGFMIKCHEVRRAMARERS